MPDWLDLHPDPVHVKREREKARALRKTEWWRSLRKTEWWRSLLQKGVCHYCGKNVGAAALTMDHVVPVSRGGKSTRGNCVPCCAACNATKRAYTPAEQILDKLFPDGAPGA